MSPATREEIAAAVEETRRQLDSRPPAPVTGEHVIPEMRVERSSIGVTVAISAAVAIASAALSGGIVWGQTSTDLKNAQTEVAKVEARVTATEKAAADARLSAAVELAENRAAHKSLMEAVERIERAVTTKGGGK